MFKVLNTFYKHNAFAVVAHVYWLLYCIIVGAMSVAPAHGIPTGRADSFILICSVLKAEVYLKRNGEM